MKQTCQVPGFLSKLWMLAGDESTNDLIRWGHDGSSFVVLDDLRFSKEVLPLYFKHCNMASFIRQLNMYGFHKVVHNHIDGLPKDGGSRRVEFQHQYFQRSQANLLPLIKRKVSSSRVSQDTGPMSQVLVEVSQVGRWCNSSHLQLLALSRDNERLWREMDYLRQKYHHQHQIIRKIIHFIASTVQSNRFHGVRRKLSIVGNKGQASSAAPRFRRSLSVQSTKSNSYLDSKDCVYSILTDITHLLQQPQSNLSGLSVSLEIPSSFAEDLCCASSATPLSSTHTSSFLSELASDSPDLQSHPQEESPPISIMTDSPSSSSSSSSSSSPPSVLSPPVISEGLISEDLPFLAPAAPALCKEVPVMFSAVTPCLTSMSSKLPSVEPDVPCAVPQELNGSAGQENFLKCPATFPDVLLPGERSQMFCDAPLVSPAVTVTVTSMLATGVSSTSAGVPAASTNLPYVSRAVPSMSPDIPLMFTSVPSGSVSVPTVATSDPSLPLEIPSMFSGVSSSGCHGVPSLTTNILPIPAEVLTEGPSVFPDILSGSCSGPSEAEGLTTVEDALSLLMEPVSHTDNITEKCGDDPLALIDCSLAAISCSLTPSEDHLDLLSEFFSPAEGVCEHGDSSVQTSERKRGAPEGEETPLHTLTVPETLPFGMCSGGDEDIGEGADILPSLLLLAQEASALERGHFSVFP